ncbi:hypothetical protein PN36_12180 [Candidatus Thiomargarita nelsonii]|uniref:AAA-ATPase-like domain-containing protein n=1 Tax=Candidatus Thiomargarita nelsonii TaxID=1003181 RepID=A0A4E0RIV3_9GAMM|nr:hypothetical protein PN36_12180 [Candidatus Thiomargarita nelsonii]
MAKVAGTTARGAERLYYYTAGYPYLVSKLCKFIDEDIIPNRAEKNGSVDDVEAAFKMIVDNGYTTTLFDSLVKNLENNRELYDLIFHFVINGKSLEFTIANPMINLAYLYGILTASEQGRCQIHNRIFEQFLEREGRLLFLAFLKPILNGRGFDFKEPVVADEQRMDIVIAYQDKRYVIELKRWYGDKYHQRGLQQLSDYLDIYSLKKGYLLIYDFNKGKSYKEELIQFQDKEIFAVWV